MHHGTAAERTDATDPAIDPGRLDALLIDLDGVITDTARLHAAAWKETFDAFLASRADRQGTDFQPFDIDRDYRTLVDGKPRLDGVASFLGARGIVLPPGEPDDPPGAETVNGIGNAKNARFLDRLRADGPPLRDGARAFLEGARNRGLRLAIVTASRNGPEVLRTAGLLPLVDALVDGNVAAELDLAGKPAPDTFLEAARRVGADPARAAVIEDAEAGVAAGRAGGFGLVVGVAPPARARALREAGADTVVSGVDALAFAEGTSAGAGGGGGRAPADSTPRGLPRALDRLDEIRDRTRGRRLAVFLDYDGTLTPIVSRPDLARLGKDMRQTVRDLADRTTVCIVSGRGREDLEGLVGLDNVVYAGAHGFDIRGPEGSGIRHVAGGAHRDSIAEAAATLRDALSGVRGAIVEDKTHAIAVHYREVPEADLHRVRRAVAAVAEAIPGLRRTGGKKVYELRPDIDWDKGRAVLWLLEVLGLESADVLPLYIGDDETDRDAFRALRSRGLSVYVSETDDGTEADYRLRNPDEVRGFLAALAGT